MENGWRSLLFVSAIDDRRIEKALRSPADAVVVDLEDAVHPETKREARAVLRRLDPSAWGLKPIVIRPNGVDTAWWADDRDLIEELGGLAAVMVPKASRSGLPNAGEVHKPLIALIETAIGVEEALAVAQDSRVRRLMLGSADLAADLGLELTPTETELAYPRARLAMASAAAGIEAPIDAVHLDVRDAESMRVSTRRGSALGFSAKACIHPEQVEIANEEHTPSAAAVDRAREVIEIAHAMADSASGVGVAPDGAFVDRPVIMRAQQILARARRMEEAERDG